MGVGESVGENESDTGLLKGTLHWPFPVPLLFVAILRFCVIQTTQRGTKLPAAAPTPSLLPFILLPPPKSFKPDFGRVELRQVEWESSQASDYSLLAGN